MVLISLVLVFLCLINLILRKSKSFFLITIIFMWLLATFTYGNADETVYQGRYENPELWANNTEYLFLVLIKICKSFNLTFIEYKGIIFFIILILISSTIWKLSSFPNVVLIMYMFYPFLMHISQIRNALATSVFIFGYRYLINDTSKKLHFKRLNLSINDLKYVFCIIIASLIHTAALIWIIILIIKKINLKLDIIISVILNIVIYFSSSISFIGNKLSSLSGAAGRLDAYFSANYQTTSFRHYGSIIPCILVMVIFVVTYIILWKVTKDKTAIMGLKLNIIMSICISMILKYSSELYRPFEGTLVLNYILLLNLIPKEQFFRVRTKISYFMSEIFIGIAVFSFMYFLVGGNIMTVLAPVFYNNYLFSIFNG